jgi:sigma-E factor negative regulatory protein RseA
MPHELTSPSPEQRRATLSALMDGDAGACDAACRIWRSDGEARAEWHAYHLIGDLMRSDEHRADAGHDARLLARVRAQLAREPVVLAPTPATAPASSAAFGQKRRARAWMMPTAVAAGFAAVAGALVVTQVSVPGGGEGAAVVASSTAAAPAAGPRPASVARPAAPVAPAEVQATMIRSPELDRYLSAHRQYANGALQVAPGGVVRQAAVAAPGR